MIFHRDHHSDVICNQFYQNHVHTNVVPDVQTAAPCYPLLQSHPPDCSDDHVMSYGIISEPTPVTSSIDEIQEDTLDMST